MTIVIFIKLVSLMVYFSLKDSLQFCSWGFYDNTIFAPVSFA